MPLQNHSFVPSRGRLGDLWLLWDQQVNLQIITKTRFYFQAQVHEPDNTSWVLVCIYSNSAHALNATIWNNIREIVRTNEKVCVISDFNAIIGESEKVGGNPNLNKNNRYFRDFLFDTGLLDLGFKGPAYTWTNRQSASNAIFERLDRAVATAAWSQRFRDAHVNYMPRVHSDHAAILLRMQKRQQSPRNFKIENWWLSIEGFAAAWENTWRDSEGQ